MSRTVTTVVIDRAVEDVWVFVSAARNLPTWCPEADQVTQLSDGPFATGTKLMVAGRIGPLRFRSTQQVTVFDSRQAIELRSVDGLIGGSLLTRVDIAPDGARTILTGTSDVQGAPRWLAVLSPGRQRDREAFFARLKESVEAQPLVTALAAEQSPVQPSAARSELTPRDPDPEPVDESQQAAPHASVAEPPLPHVNGMEAPVAKAEAPVAPAEAPIASVEAQVAKAEAPVAAETQTTHAESSTAEKDVPELVGGERVAPDASPVTASESAVDVAPARRPVRKPRAAADERVEISHAPTADEVGLVLRLETERAPAPTFEITRSGATIGRAPENTVRLDDLSVSRQHARIAYRQGGYWLSDLKSASGTWVDEAKLSAPRRLAPGQSIRIGILRLSAMLVAASDEIPTGSDDPAPPSELAGRGRGRR